MKTFKIESHGNDCMLYHYYVYIPERRVVIQTTVCSLDQDVQVSVWKNPDSSLPQEVQEWWAT